jgi:polyisoprenyl-phosphate glycosyltransferase
MKHILLIPVFNDWKSLNKLILKLDNTLKFKKKIQNEILIINDNSTNKLVLNFKKLKLIRKIKIISLKNNFGSQKAIAIGLNYLKKIKGNFYITVMDGDGEDGPNQVKTMLQIAISNPSYVITSNRKKREEALIIVFLYKLHLLITYLFTLKWITFGNFTTFNKKNLNDLFKDNSSWYAHSSSILKNCKIKRLYFKREKRYFGKSKLGLSALIEHSLRVNSVFYKNTFLLSLVYLFLTFIFLEGILKIFFIFGFLLFNFLIIFIKIKHWRKKINNISTFIKKIELFKT